MGDAISHAVLPGVVLAHVFAVPLFIGAFISGFGSALLTGYIKKSQPNQRGYCSWYCVCGYVCHRFDLVSHVETDQH